MEITIEYAIEKLMKKVFEAIVGAQHIPFGAVSFMHDCPFYNENRSLSYERIIR